MDEELARAWAEGRLPEVVELAAGATDPAVVLLWATALRLAGRATLAARALDRALAGPVVPVLRARLLEERALGDPVPDRLEEAIDALRAVGDRAGVVRLRARRADELVRVAGPRAAEAALAGDDVTGFAEGQVTLAELAMARQDARAMAEHAARAQALAPARSDPPALQLRARIANQRATAALLQGDPDAARTGYALACALLQDRGFARPDLAFAWRGLAECARTVDDRTEARACYRQAAAVHPDPTTELNLAILAIEASDWDEARTWLASMPSRPRPRIVALAADLARAACATECGDDAAADLALRPFARGWPPETAAEPDVLALARTAARVAGAAGRPDREVRARRVALAAAARLGRVEDVAIERAALATLRERGASPVLGPFRLVARIAGGAYGTVYRAVHDGGREVAVKVLDPRVAPDAVARELRAVAALDHPNVVRLLDHGRIDAAAAALAPELAEGSAWIATELCGETIEPLLGRAPWARVRDVLLAVLDGLAHAHARGLLHLDVKPANLLLAEGTTKLADFGLASAIGSGDHPFAGTPAWAAPEQFRRAPLGPSTDLYALGCVAVALVSGAPPFDGDSLEEVREAHLSAPPRIAPSIAVPRDLVGWLRALLAKRPVERYARAADAARALRALGDPEGGGGALVRPRTLGAQATVSVPLGDDLTEATEATAEARFAPPVHALPETWEARRATPLLLADAGLGLFGLRRPPLVGRAGPREVLWAALRDVVERGVPRVVALEAEAGLGASALGAWLAERAHEVGAAEVLALDACAHAVEPPIGALARLLAGRIPRGDRRANPLDLAAIACLARPLVLWIDRSGVDADVSRLFGPLRARGLPVLVVVAARPGRFGDDLTRVPLGPLAPAEQEELLDALLPLAPATRARLGALTAGSPRFAVQLLTHLVAADLLDAGPDGWTLADEAAVPRDLNTLLRDRLALALAGTTSAARACLQVAAAFVPAVDDLAWADACARLGLPFDPDGRDALVAARLASARAGAWALEDAAIASLLAAADVRARFAYACAAAVLERAS